MCVQSLSLWADATRARREERRRARLAPAPEPLGADLEPVPAEPAATIGDQESGELVGAGHGSR